MISAQQMGELNPSMKTGNRDIRAIGREGTLGNCQRQIGEGVGGEDGPNGGGRVGLNHLDYLRRKRTGMVRWIMDEPSEESPPSSREPSSHTT